MHLYARYMSTTINSQPQLKIYVQVLKYFDIAMYKDRYISWCIYIYINIHILRFKYKHTKIQGNTLTQTYQPTPKQITRNIYIPIHANI